MSTASWGSREASRTFLRMPGVISIVYKLALYLNLHFFVCPLHMNIYGPRAKPERQLPFTELINKAFVELDLGIVSEEG